MPRLTLDERRKRRLAPSLYAREDLTQAHEESEVDERHWWLYAHLAKHRNTPDKVHPYLVRLMRARGVSALTNKAVLGMLDSTNPEKFLQELLGTPQEEGELLE